MTGVEVHGRGRVHAPSSKPAIMYGMRVVDRHHPAHERRRKRPDPGSIPTGSTGSRPPQFKNYKVPYVDGLENTLSPESQVHARSLRLQGRPAPHRRCSRFDPEDTGCRELWDDARQGQPRRSDRRSSKEIRPQDRAGLLRPHQRRPAAVDRRHVLPDVSSTIPRRPPST
ncbi:MAG: hypothetical protein MZU97_06705 [Bacillus subtilis]|nr:hypothetical protein [Bacillus subtilis]